jgi:thymidylate synthase
MNEIPMKEYYDLLKKIREEGRSKSDRTETGTKSIFGHQMRFNLQKGFPLLTGKAVPMKLVTSELLWFLSGSTNNEDLRKMTGTKRDTIWEEWAAENGDLGPIYGQQWRNWLAKEGVKVDQIGDLIANLKEDPFSRRHVVLAWNPGVLPLAKDVAGIKMSPQDNVLIGRQSLAACHALFQMNVVELNLSERLILNMRRPDYDQTQIWKTSVEKYDEKLDKIGVQRLGVSCQVYIRSSDTFLGLPFNIASYAALTHMIGHVVGYAPLDLVVTLGDAHIYNNHNDQVVELLERPYESGNLPQLEIVGNPLSIDDFTMDSFRVVDYKPLPAIPAPVAI